MKTNEVSLENDTSKADLRQVWDAIDTPIYLVVDEKGDNMGNGQIRRLDAGHWLYVDDVDGFSIMDNDSAALLDCTEAE